MFHKAGRGDGHGWVKGTDKLLSAFQAHDQRLLPENHRPVEVRHGSKEHLFAQVMLNLLKHMLSQPARSGQLTAKDVNQRCGTLRSIFFST